MAQIPHWLHKVYMPRYNHAHAEWCNAHVPNNSWAWWLEIDPNSGEDFTVFGFDDEHLATQFALLF